MFILPYSTELKLNKIPFITYAVILICILVFSLQINNRMSIQNDVSSYCSSIFTIKGKLDDIASNRNYCAQILSSLHRYVRSKDDVDKFISDRIVYDRHQTASEKIEIIKKHYQRFVITTVESLDKQLMHYSDSINPVTMLTSTLSHSNFGHIFFNLLFFLAFAPALEILINNRWQFLKLLLIISFASGIAYVITMLASEPIPTLGLSGVVMGMIGLSAFLIPKAKIRVLMWFIVIVKRLYIPVWIVAVWYIGWDSWGLITGSGDSGINLVAHVSGGITGYFLGWLWFKDRREEYQYELDEEIENRRSQRVDKGSYATYKGGQQEGAERLRQKMAKRDSAAFMSRLYNAVICDRDSDAIVYMLEDSDTIGTSVEVYEELFESMSQWKPSRAQLCMGRLVINLLMLTHQFGRAIEYTERCQSISKDFVLALPSEVLLLAQNAMKLQKYELAYYLVREAGSRYSGKIDDIQCRLLEAELLWKYLGDQSQAKALITRLLTDKSDRHRQEIVELASQMK